MAKRTMEIEVSLDLGPAEAQMRGFVARYNTQNVAVPSPAAGVPVGVGGGAAGSLNAGATEQLANAAALATAEARATMYAPMASGSASPNWGMLMQGAMQNAMYPEGASSPNWSYLMSQAGGNQPVASPVARAPAQNRGFFGSPTSGAVRAITFLAAHQVAQTYQALERADLARSLASTDAEAFGASVEGVTSGLGGIIGSVVGTAWDVGGSVLGLREYTPGGQRAIAETENRRRGILDTAQTNLYSRQSAESIRAASAVGNREAERARISAEFDAKIRGFEKTEKDAYGRLGAGQKYKYFGLFESDEYYDYDVKDGGMRAALGAEARGAAADAVAAAKQRDFELNQSNKAQQREQFDFYAESNSNITRNYLVAGGWSSRDVARNDLNSRTLNEARDAFRKFGVTPAGSAAYDQALREGRSRTAAQEFEWQRYDSELTADENASAAADQLRAAGRPFDARLSELRSSAAREIREYQKQNPGPSAALAAIQNAWQEKIRAAEAEQGRSAYSQTIALDSVDAVQIAMSNNDPLEARLSQIRGDRDLALQGLSADDPHRAQIERNSRQAELLATRDELRNRLDLNRSLAGASERASLGLHPGAASDAAQIISSILENTDLDVGHLEDRDYMNEAARRRRLGLNQLRGAEANFFRSFSFDEASPSRVFGTLDTSKITKQFQDAENAIPKTGRAEGGGGSMGAWTTEKIDTLLRDIAKMADGFYPARVGS